MVKSKDGVIRRNLDRILVSEVTPQPSNESRHSQVSLIYIKKDGKNSLLPRHINKKTEKISVKEKEKKK